MGTAVRCNQKLQSSYSTAKFCQPGDVCDTHRQVIVEPVIIVVLKDLRVFDKNRCLGAGDSNVIRQQRRLCIPALADCTEVHDSFARLQPHTCAVAANQSTPSSSSLPDALPSVELYASGVCPHSLNGGISRVYAHSPAISSQYY